LTHNSGDSAKTLFFWPTFVEQLVEGVNAIGKVLHRLRLYECVVVKEMVLTWPICEQLITVCLLRKRLHRRFNHQVHSRLTEATLMLSPHNPISDEVILDERWRRLPKVTALSPFTLLSELKR
jgi:hypothetical protein